MQPLGRLCSHARRATIPRYQLFPVQRNRPLGAARARERTSPGATESQDSKSHQWRPVGAPLSMAPSCAARPRQRNPTAHSAKLPVRGGSCRLGACDCLRGAGGNYLAVASLPRVCGASPAQPESSPLVHVSASRAASPPQQPLKRGIGRVTPLLEPHKAERGVENY